MAPESPIQLVRVDLEGAAEQINRTHRLVAESGRDMVVHAIQCGRLLAQVKESLEHGYWLGWLADNFEGSEWTAQAYIRVSEIDPGRVTDLTSLRDALRFLAASNPRTPSDSPAAKASAPVSFRFRDVTITRVSRLAECRGRSQTVVVEDAIEAFEELWDARQAGTEVVLRGPDGSERIWGRL